MTGKNSDIVTYYNYYIILYISVFECLKTTLGGGAELNNYVTTHIQ